MEGNGSEVLAGEVFVGDGLGGVEGFLVGLETGVDGVGDDAGGERLAVGRVDGDAVLGFNGSGSEGDCSGGEEAGAQHTGIVGCFGLGWGEDRGVKLEGVATATPSKPLHQATSAHKDPLSVWHLLSLDAPTVAALWTWFLASANHVHLPVSSTLSMALAVWMLYAADRLMDVRLLVIDPTRREDLEARHYFHLRYRTAFLTGILLASLALAALLPRLDAAAIRLYLILGGLVAGYFILIHATGSDAVQEEVAHRLPKEVAVGLCFAAATFIPTVARRPDLRLTLLPIALLFAILCSLNCLFIYSWEHEDRRVNRPTHVITRVALRNLVSLTSVLACSSIVLALFDRHVSSSIPSASALSAVILLALHRRRHAIARTTLRAAADLALATPIFFFPFLT